MKRSTPRLRTDRNPSFSKLLAKDTMRHHTVTLDGGESIATAVRTFIKRKADAVLVVDGDGRGVGVVTKTEIMGAFFALIHPETPLNSIMGSPVIHCGPEDSLEAALITMQRYGIHRIYVFDANRTLLGTLSYPDIVGYLYRYCYGCEFSQRSRTLALQQESLRLHVKDVMTDSIVIARIDESIMEVIGQLASYHIGALLIVDEEENPAGVISKTDLALAYRRGVGLDQPAQTIMSAPVCMCRADAPLEEAIRQMIFSEISRIFVYTDTTQSITGVLTLSDAARARSGSCQACSSTRIIPKE